LIKAILLLNYKLNYYFRKCVGILSEPEEDMWFCPACDPDISGKGPVKGHKKRKGRKN
jgi:hypothetical protein